MARAASHSGALGTVTAGIVTVALAIVLPPWLVAIPVTCLSVAVALAVVRQPNLANRALRTITTLLTAPTSPDKDAAIDADALKH